MQAAGRIHRLGQTRDIFIKRYCFRDSIEAACASLHDKIKSGEIVVRDGRFPPEAYDLFRRHGPSAGLFAQVGEAHAKVIEGKGLKVGARSHPFPPDRARSR